jgi:hypothetical protein
MSMIKRFIQRPASKPQPVDAQEHPNFWMY